MKTVYNYCIGETIKILQAKGFAIDLVYKNKDSFGTVGEAYYYNIGSKNIACEFMDMGFNDNCIFTRNDPTPRHDMQIYWESEK